MSESETTPKTMRTFFIIWAGQLVSVLGSGLTNFALGVYIYNLTGSATQFGLVLLTGTLPRLIFAPIAGALVDRWDRRTVLILSDTGNALVTVLVWFLLLANSLSIWTIYLVTALGSTLSIFQEPAYTAAITLIVPKEQYGRASGLMQLIGAVTGIVTPILAGFLLVTIGLQGILLIDIITYLPAVGALLLIRIPRPSVSEEGKKSRGSIWQESFYGWSYLRQRTGLLGMLILFMFVNFALGFFGALLTPMILSFTTADVLGLISSAGGVGVLVGSLLMSAWGGAKRKVNSLIGSMVLFGLALSVLGASANAWVIGGASLVFFILLPIASGSSQAIWQVKVPPDIQGRVFAVRSLVASAARPLSLLIAGPLADYIFEPGMQPGGSLAGIFGPLVGIGPGRGMGLIFVFTGLFISVINIIGYLTPRIRNVEDEIPDYEEMPAPA